MDRAASHCNTTRFKEHEDPTHLPLRYAAEKPRKVHRASYSCCLTRILHYAVHHLHSVQVTVRMTRLGGLSRQFGEPSEASLLKDGSQPASFWRCPTSPASLRPVQFLALVFISHLFGVGGNRLVFFRTRWCSPAFRFAAKASLGRRQSVLNGRTIPHLIHMQKKGSGRRQPIVAMQNNDHYENPHQEDRNSVLPLENPDQRPPQLNTTICGCQCGCVSGGRGGDEGSDRGEGMECLSDFGRDA